jgi:hypothetical protein
MNGYTDLPRMCDLVANHMAPYPINNRQHSTTNGKPLQSPEQKIRPTATKMTEASNTSPS